MAAVRLTRYECERNLLPAVCTQCGAPAEGGPRLALPTPTWNLIVGLLGWFCPPVVLFVVARLRARRSFVVPMCEPHRADWQRRDRLTTRLYSICVIPAYVAAVSAILMLSVTEVHGEFLELLPLIYMAFVYAWIVASLVILMHTVRVMRVQPRWIELWGVRQDFIRALIADRIRTRESDPNRLGSYGDVRDDYDDESARL